MSAQSDDGADNSVKLSAAMTVLNTLEFIGGAPKPQARHHRFFTGRSLQCFASSKL